MSPRVSNRPTSDEIRRVALELFSARGFHGTSVRDVVAAVGIKESSLYNHFPSKEAILWDVTRTTFEEINAAWEAEQGQLETAPAEDRIAAFVRTEVRYHALHRQEATIINAQLNSLSPAHRVDAVRLRSAYEAQLSALIEEYRADHRDSVLHVKVTTFAILQMCLAVAGWYDPDLPGGVSVDELCDLYAALALRMIG